MLYIFSINRVKLVARTLTATVKKGQREYGGGEIADAMSEGEISRWRWQRFSRSQEMRNGETETGSAARCL